MIPTPPDRFEAWLEADVALESSDPRFIVRRGRPEDFERIFDVVDAGFGRRRPRSQYDWLYRRNPFGLARVWLVIEVESGEIARTAAEFPWPIYYGDEVLPGQLGGDAAALPRFQRQGLAQLRRAVGRSHAWARDRVGISGPNHASRNLGRKRGEANQLHGPLRAGLALIRSSRLMELAGVPGALAKGVGSLGDPVFELWRRLALRARERATSRIESVGRFSADYDDVTERTMFFPKFWCPHNTDFLNWRYLDHPTEEYSAIALVEGERPIGYAVLGMSPKRATLSEFAVDPADVAGAAKLLSAAFDLAREAGCASLNFFSTPVWRHWPLFRGAGFLPYRSANHLQTLGMSREPEVHNARHWQLTPGDRDYH